MDIKEFLASAGLGMATTIVDSLLTNLLDNIKKNNDSDPTLIVDAVKAGDNFLKLLERAAAKTKTTLDDKAIAMIHDPVKNFASKEGIQL
jgi:hypothetical protein